MSKKSGKRYESTSKDEVVWGKGSSFNVCDSVGGTNWGGRIYMVRQWSRHWFCVWIKQQAGIKKGFNPEWNG